MVEVEVSLVCLVLGVCSLASIEALRWKGIGEVGGELGGVAICDGVE
jgi:hypothetical protein